MGGRKERKFGKTENICAWLSFIFFYYLVTVTGSHSKCFGSRSAFGLDPDSIRPVDPDPDSDSRSRSKFAEGFSCSLDVLYGGLGISKLQFLIRICTYSA